MKPTNKMQIIFFKFLIFLCEIGIETSNEKIISLNNQIYQQSLENRDEKQD